MSRKLLFIALLALLAVSAPARVHAQVATQKSSLDARFIPIPPSRPIHPPPGDGWIWVEGYWQTVYQRTWQPPTYETISENVWVPEQYGWQTVCRWENGQYVQRQEWVLFPGHYEVRTRQVVVSPGGWIWTSKQVWVPGHWERVGPVPVPTPPPPPMPPPQPPTARPPGLEPFSPLWDWPADSHK